MISPEKLKEIETRFCENVDQGDGLYLVRNKQAQDLKDLIHEVKRLNAVICDYKEFESSEVPFDEDETKLVLPQEPAVEAGSIIISDVKRMDFRNGDTIVFKFKDSVSRLTKEFIHREVDRFFGKESRVLILEDGTDIEIIRQEPQKELQKNEGGGSMEVDDLEDFNENS